MLGQRAQMFVVTRIGYVYQAFVKASQVCATFITTHQQDSLPLRIKGKRYPPDLAIPCKA